MQSYIGWVEMCLCCHKFQIRRVPDKLRRVMRKTCMAIQPPRSATRMIGLYSRSLLNNSEFHSFNLTLKQHNN